jgi:hypothetical protein
MASVRTLTDRELNRTTLARQMLLDRATLPAATAVERLAGLQAQQAQAPFVGLWTRLAGFRREELAEAITARSVVKATLMRATLHLFSAADFVEFRTALQPVLDGAQASISKARGEALEVDRVVVEARTYIAEQPRTFAEISAHFAALMPDTDIGAIRYTIRTKLPLVQVPVTGGWSYPGNPHFTLAEPWIGRPVAAEDNLPALIRRYLAAFGPATVADIQRWSGLGKLKERLEALRPALHVYRDSRGRELFDLPELPWPPPEAVAPVRFLPEFDNLLLGHERRTRIIADEHRKRVYLPGLRVAATFLVDGFVAGVWKVTRQKGAATLVLEPFGPLSAAEEDALVEEGGQLLRFVACDAGRHDVQFWRGSSAN